MKLAISNINDILDILKEAYCKYDSRSAEEYMAYVDGFTDLLNLAVMEEENDNSRSEQATI